jgi:2-polyprenyl-3-methyl-5-hydroxy-6-metoxy-1,4-benzoquinol methylase
MMTTEAASYRWNTSGAAEAYDVAAPVIHPCYVEVQDAILDALPYGHEAAFELVDIGGGSGRLAERVLEQYPGARVTVVDQSAPFLALAERWLARFAPRAAIVECRLQDWASRGPVSPRPEDRVSEKRGHVDVIVSTSAIHHLEPAEKRALYRACFAALAPGGMFINGDEFRPAHDAAFLALLEEWSAHMRSAIANGDIPESFANTFDQWHDRNIRRFGEPKKSGDDCLETLDVQMGYLRDIGFRDVECTWAAKLWAVLVGQK